MESNNGSTKLEREKPLLQIDSKKLGSLREWQCAKAPSLLKGALLCLVNLDFEWGEGIGTVGVGITGELSSGVVFQDLLF